MKKRKEKIDIAIYFNGDIKLNLYDVEADGCMGELTANFDHDIKLEVPKQTQVDVCVITRLFEYNARSEWFEYGGQIRFSEHKIVIEICSAGINQPINLWSR